MDENSLYSLRRAPPEEFARQLRASLQRSARPEPTPGRVGKFAAVIIACLILAGGFCVPSVRVAAAAFLDMFRVVHFAAVPIDASSLRRLRDSGLDFRQMLADQVQVAQPPQGPTSYATIAEAAAAAGFRVYVPGWLPVGWNTESPSVEVLGPSTARVTANTARLAQILAALSIEDVSIPQGLNGRSASIRTSPAVTLRWQHEGQRLQLRQSPSPQVDFPSGTNLPALAEIGLRILGLPREDAYRLAQSIDWRTTLLVPIPANAVSFRQVSVQGGSGLLLELADMGARPRRAGALLLWSDGSRVFSLQGTLGPEQILEMAQTLQ